MRCPTVSLFFIMMNVQDLANRYGLHPKRVRERLAELGSLVDPHLVRGRQNAILITDAALAIFDRLVQLEKEGYSIPTAVQVMQKEALVQQPTNGHLNGDGAATDGSTPEVQEIVTQQNVTIQHLQKEVEWLRKMVETKDQQLSEKDQVIRAVTAGPKIETQHLSRWQALRLAILGR